MKYIIILLSIASTLFLSSCEKAFTTVLDIYIPHTPIIGLEVAIDPQLGTQASISQTVSVTGFAQPSPILNAKAYLFENNLMIDSFQKDPTNNLYYAGFKNYVSNRNYKIQIDAPNFKSVTAEDKMPNTIKVTNTQYTAIAKEYKLYPDDDTLTMFDEVKITFLDESTDKDYYEVNVYPDSITLGDLDIISFDTDIDNTDQSDFLGGNQKLVSNPFSLLDVTYNGQSKTLILYLPSNQNPVPNSKWNITMRHISPNLYKYSKTKKLYQQNDGNPFAEPVQIHSNVTNGIGIFGLMKDTLLKF